MAGAGNGAAGNEAADNKEGLEDSHISVPFSVVSVINTSCPMLMH